MAGYLNDGVLLYLEKLVDWGEYFRLAKGEDVSAKEKLRALLDGLREDGAPELAYIQDQAELRLLALDPTAVQRRSTPSLGAGGPGDLTPEQLQELIRQFQQKQGPPE